MRPLAREESCTHNTEPFARDSTGAIELFGSHYVRDPYRVFRYLVRRGPIHRVVFPSGVHAWLITGRRAAQEILTHPDIRKDHSIGNDRWRAKASIMPEPQHSRLQAHLLHQDGETHARMRRLLRSAFSAQAAANHQTMIADCAHELIDRFPPRGDVDLVRHFTDLLPFMVLAHVIGLPDHLACEFKREWGAVVRVVGPDDPRRAEYEELLQALEEYIGRVISTCRDMPDNSVLSTLTQAHKNGLLCEEELSSMIFQLLVAGQEPVSNQLAISMLGLLNDPIACDEFRAQRILREERIDELIRFDGAFALATWRFFASDTDFHGTTIPAGDSIIVALNAANRDIDGNATAISFHTRHSQHFGFGGGKHYCPGAALARKQLAIGLGALVDRLPGLRLASQKLQPDWVPAVLTRGLFSLPVSYDTRLPAPQKQVDHVMGQK